MTPKLRQLLLEELSTQHDAQKVCLKWDITEADLKSYSLFSTPSQNTVSKPTLDRYGKPRTHHRLTTFG